MRYLIVFLFSIGLAAGHPGVGIVMDRQGNVYYTDLKQVWRIDPHGKKEVVVESVHTHELALDENDNLLGEHLWYEGERINKWGHYVWRRSPQGVVQKIIDNTEGFRSHYSFVRDRAGNMYWADRENDCQKITKRDKHGLEHSYGNSCLHDIRWITASADGMVYAVDHNDVKKIEPNGKISTRAIQLQEKSRSPFSVEDSPSLMGLSVDANDNVFVASYGGRKVKKISGNGNVTTVMEANGMWSPTGVLAAPNGDLWILECTATNAVRVERFKSNGERVVY